MAASILPSVFVFSALTLSMKPTYANSRTYIGGKSVGSMDFSNSVGLDLFTNDFGGVLLGLRDN